ncbi:MAG: hypothetical protein MI757_00120 [Pirellulales bacterium]|nr:hypothetical protein [Pirellulales bacterium]
MNWLLKKISNVWKYRVAGNARAAYRQALSVPVELDLDLVRRHQGESTYLQDTQVDRGGSLHVSITSHFAEDRVGFLDRVLESLKRAPFEHVHVAVHTNSMGTAAILNKVYPEAELVLHDSLEDPFMLAWCHRDYMAERVDEFDAFLYIEDDIVVPEGALARWKAERVALQRRGFLYGFARIELNYRGALVSSDLEHRATLDDVVEIDGKLFLDSPFPYQACWLYDQATMREFVSSPFYRFEHYDSDPQLKRLGIRERAAFGYILSHIPEGHHSRSLIPLSGDYQICREGVVYHLPSNYGKHAHPHPAGLGTIAIEGAVIAKGQPRQVDSALVN